MAAPIPLDMSDPMGVERMPPDRTPIPTQDDLILDDTLSDLERIVKYGTGSVPLQRLVHAKMIGRVSMSEGCVPEKVFFLHPPVLLLFFPFFSRLLHPTLPFFSQHPLAGVV